MSRRSPDRDDSGNDAAIERQRIDKWIWHARVVKTRSDAAALVSAGRVRINGDRIRDPAYSVKAGHVLTIALDSVVRIMKVEGFAARRGDAEQARALYSEPDRPASP